MRVVVLLIVAGCGRLDFGELGDAGPTSIPCTTYGGWGPPVSLTGIDENTTEGPSISADGLDLYFHSVRGGTVDLFIAHRATTLAAFTTATKITELSTLSDDRDPLIRGNHLYFTSSFGAASNRLAMAVRNGAVFEPPAYSDELGEGIFGPWVSADELELFHTYSGGLYRSVRASTADPWSGADNVSELGVAGFATFTADELTIIFEAGNGANPFLKTAKRSAPGALFSPPTAITELQPGLAGLGDPDLSSDGLTLYFAADPGTGVYGIYTSQRICLD